jgi:hypothetical protein
MRVYAVNATGEFVEYKEEAFGGQHTEKTMEDWLEGNPDAILEDGGLLVIGRQVTTNLGGSIDLLAVDRQGDVAVIELKRDRTPRETLAQALEYASFAAQLDYDQLEGVYQDYTGEEGASLADVHRRQFELGEDEAVSFNKDQRIVIVGNEIVPAIRQTSVYLRRRGLRVTCLEFSYFASGPGQRLLSIDVAVGEEPTGSGPIATRRLPPTTQERFLSECDEAGKAIFAPLLRMADESGLPIHWGSRGFSLNVDHDGDHISLCLGFPAQKKRNQTVQSLAITFREMEHQLGDVDELIDAFRPRFTETGLFQDYGSFRDVRYRVEARPAAEQVKTIVGLVRDLGHEVKMLAEGRQEQ